MAKPMLAYNPVMQFFNNDGTVLIGGKIYIYQPGSVNLLNTYPTAADAVAGTNPNPNPMICDASGRPSAGSSPYEMYTTQAYKMVVKTSADATVRTIDNVVTLGQLISTTAKSSNYTVTVADRDKLVVVDTGAGNVTITLPAAATAGDGFEITIKKNDTSTNTLTIQANAAELIEGSNTATLTENYGTYDLICDGTQWVAVVGSTLNKMVWRDVAVSYSDLSSAASKIIVTSTGTQRYRVRDVIISGSTSFATGDRNISLTDNTSTWTVLPAVTLQAMDCYRWGASADVPFPATATHLTTASAAGTNIVLKYSGGTSDYVSGSLTLSICYEKVS